MLEFIAPQLEEALLFKHTCVLGMLGQLLASTGFAFSAHAQEGYCSTMQNVEGIPMFLLCALKPN